MEYSISEFAEALNEKQWIQKSDILEMTMRRNSWMMVDGLNDVAMVV